ncbi:MAG: hypothetical protein ACKVI3_10215, partial [Verrucomicrobiia bacterium]
MAYHTVDEDPFAGVAPRVINTTPFNRWVTADADGDGDRDLLTIWWDSEGVPGLIRSGMFVRLYQNNGSSLPFYGVGPRDWITCPHGSIKIDGRLHHAEHGGFFSNFWGDFWENLNRNRWFEHWGIVTLADWEGDGDLDLYMGSSIIWLQDNLFQNNSSGFLAEPAQMWTVPLGNRVPVHTDAVYHLDLNT